MPILLLFLIAVAWRLLSGMGGAAWLPNFSPLAAIALCGAIYLPKRIAIALPLAALFLTDLVLNHHYHAPLLDPAMIAEYIGIALAGCIGLALRARPVPWLVLGGSLVGSLAFYLITNSAAWFSLPYSKSFAGWVQALTTGLPGYPPTWVFLRNSLLGDLLFTAVFIGCVAASRSRSPIPHGTATFAAGAGGES